MNSRIRLGQVVLALPVGVAFVAFTSCVSAQVQTETTTATHAPTVTTHVERGEVVYVKGNELIVKMDDGSLRDFPHVPDNAKVLVDGKELGIHDLQVGMKLQRTVTTTTTPKTITTVQTVTGRVFHVSPPTSVILTLADGTNQQFKIPEGQKFNVNGQMTDAWGLRKGMTINATRVVEEPVTQVQKQAKLTGTMPPAPTPPPADQPILVAVLVPAPAPPAAAAAAPAELPKTGSPLPLIGFLGVLVFVAWWGLRSVRNIG